MARIVNIKFKCCGYRFDAAVDCDWELHCYGETSNSETPIELFNLDCPDWDVRMVYQNERNDQHEKGEYNHTFVDWDNLIKATRKWVREMKK